MIHDTESLLLLRALGRAQPEDYIDWAVQQLCEGADGPDLRILAGLSPRFDRDDVELYFSRSCQELGLSGLDEPASPLETAARVRRAYDKGRITPAEVVSMMADVYSYSSTDSREELLLPWNALFEEMTWKDGYFYPALAPGSLQNIILREWSLLDQALALTPPRGWLRLMLCSDCGHAGGAHTKKPSLAAIICGLVKRRRAWSAAVCARCGSTKLSALIDPDARSAYLQALQHVGD